MTLYYLSDTWPWLGNHTGYHRLPKYITDSTISSDVVTTKYGVFQRMLGRAYSICHGWGDRRDSAYAAAEWKYSRRINSKDIFHVLYYDMHYHMWERWQKTPKNIIATIHHPPGRAYPPGMRENLKRLSSAIVLTTVAMDFYEGEIGKGRVRFISHGVDTEFFYPPGTMLHAPRVLRSLGEGGCPMRLLFTGQNGRNTTMFHRVVLRLAERYPDLRFDLLVPSGKRYANGLKQLTAHPSVTWHENISDEALRAMYQQSYLLLQPMEDCAANNAIVESLACGLPVVTTDVGGVRDYGGGSVYPVVANDNDDAMVDLVERYIAKPGWRDEVGRKCRDFTDQNLAWPAIAKKHIAAYKELLV